MRTGLKHLSITLLPFAVCLSAASQAPLASGITEQPTYLVPSTSSAFDSPSAASGVTPAVQLLTEFKDSDVKFDLPTLMELLRDRRHEGWVLAAYPDPKTSRPLIGAGVSLDLPAREHPQRDPLNPHPFIEPSSAELWQAAGLDSARLQAILDAYQGRLAASSTRRFRNQIRTLTPQITDHEATLLLRVAAIQAIDNAKAYCRNFDQLTASQQMALAQLVYQMGVNLEEFSRFLGLMNADFGAGVASAETQIARANATDREFWKAVQQSLVQSQWARLYRVRAASVIAMLDPEYDDSPLTAERRLGATLMPAVVRHRRGHSAASRQLASATRNRGKGAKGKAARAHTKRRA